MTWILSTAEKQRKSIFKVLSYVFCFLREFHRIVFFKRSAFFYFFEQRFIKTVNLILSKHIETPDKKNCIFRVFIETVICYVNSH